MAYRLSEEKWSAIKSYLGKVWDNPGSYPDNALILSLSDEETTRIFTKKRLELIRLIQGKNPQSASALGKLANRKLSAVMRDLELLKKFHLVELNKKGKTVVPAMTKEIIVIPLAKLPAKKPEEIKAL
ncbi:MAG: hypothetical protein HY394_02780 [Candidatus Diapherotrites archaeon]|nr:hypothetical protein [Candidatus Diapherotrites archaeon]